MEPEETPATNTTTASVGTASVSTEGDSSSVVAAGKPPPTPQPVSIPVTDTALRVLRIMLNARTYAPAGKKAKPRKLDAINIDGETCLMVSVSYI